MATKLNLTYRFLYGLKRVPFLSAASRRENVNYHGLCTTVIQHNSARSHAMSSKDVLSGVVTQRIRKGITLYMNECVVSPLTAGPHDKSRPLLLLLPWLGSRPQAQAKYYEIYLKTGFDVLVVESEVGMFLWPRWGLDYSRQLLELLESERFSQRPILVHALSIGGYTFAQMLVHVTKDVQRYQGLTSRIRGHIYDSLVIGSLEHMAIGLSKNVFPRIGGLVKHASLLYFRVFKQQTVDYFNIGINTFWNTPITAPALFFFCENDDLSDAHTLEEMLEDWKRRGLVITSKKWEKSVHAGHMRAHPQEYLSILENFLYSINMVPLKAKM